MPFIQIDFDEHIGVIAFDNYAKRNALSHDLIAETLAAFGRLEKEGARVVILRAAPDHDVWSSCLLYTSPSPRD